MPPDIVRPVASTTLGCLITMAYRLNMIWMDFRLDEGRMRATGGGRSFSTSIVRGMGLVVEYNTDTSGRSWPIGTRILSKAADQVRHDAIFGSMRSLRQLINRLTRRKIPSEIVALSQDAAIVSSYVPS